MKRFIKNVTLYALIFLVILSFLAYAGFHLARHKILQNFPETENIILGDSNSQRAVDDAKLTSTKNFSSTAENYRLSYYKLLFIHKHNTELERVILSFSPQNLFFAFPNNHRHSYSALIILDPSDYKAYYFGHLTIKRYFYFLKYGLNHVINFIFGNEIELGGFLKINSKEQQFYEWHSAFCLELEKGLITKMSEEQIHYLNLIIEYCQNQNIALNLLVTPKHKILFEDSSYHAKDFFNFYNQYYGHIPIINFSDLQINEAEFQDPMHLNELGAEKLTQKLSQILE